MGNESSYSIYKVGETNEDVSGEVNEGEWLSMKKKQKQKNYPFNCCLFVIRMLNHRTIEVKVDVRLKTTQIHTHTHLPFVRHTQTL